MLHLEVLSSNWWLEKKKATSNPFLRRVKRTNGNWELLTCPCHLCAGEDHGTHLTHTKARGRNVWPSSSCSMTCWPTYTLDKGKSMDVIYLDVSKAFDCVSHSILQKLATQGLDRCTLYWVKSAWRTGPRVWWWTELNLPGDWSWVVFLTYQY